MRAGYVRISSEGEDLEVELDGLKKYKCEKIFQEKVL
tara:strand:- start:7335 stop:7445 length:111 start_codon:yes stop_codon:yes gene_type:complete